MAGGLGERSYQAKTLCALAPEQSFVQSYITFCGSFNGSSTFHDGDLDNAMTIILIAIRQCSYDSFDLEGKEH